MAEEWIGIIPPPAPPADDMLWLWGLSVALLSFLLFLFYRWRSRRDQYRRLLRLQRALSRQDMAPKTAGFELADILRKQFSTTRLDRLDFAGHQSRWQAFLRDLQLGQYAKSQPTHKQMQKLLTDARKWLKP